MSDYSPNESKLFDHYDFSIAYAADLNPPQAWKILALRAFVRNDGSLAEAAVRRGIAHLDVGRYRGNDEFEQLIAI